jgi:hypothetical protein
LNWLNLQVSLVRSPEYVGCDPVQRATWFNVLAYSAEQENHGRISGARQWKDRQWQQTCGVTLAEVEGAGPLLEWDGDSLVVWAYPTEKQAEVQAKREGGKKGGERSAAARAEASAKQSQKLPAELPPSSASSNGSSSASTEGKGREGKDKGKESLPPTPQGAPASPPLGGGKKKVPETAEGKRIARMFKRRESTPWSDKEIRCYRKLVSEGQITPENLETLERYYAEETAKGEEGRQRRDLGTFLNNFTGELDRARACAPAPSGIADHPMWRDFLKSKGSPYKEQRFTDEHTRTTLFWAWKKNQSFI